MHCRSHIPVEVGAGRHSTRNKCLKESFQPVEPSRHGGKLPGQECYMLCKSKTQSTTMTRERLAVRSFLEPFCGSSAEILVIGNKT